MHRAVDRYHRRVSAALNRWMLTAVLLLFATACSRPAPPVSALLVTFDTTRADVLGCYGGRATTSPRLDELAASAFVFDSARTTAPLTTPAHLSMLTGLVPPRHAVRDNGYAPLPASVPTLAEAARAQGVATAAFVSAAVLDAAYGLARGFDVYDSPPLDPGATDLHVVERGAAATLSAARAWLAARDREQPFFLWVHFFDPHAPYEPPADLAGAGSPYLGEVAAADRALGVLLDDLRAEGTLDRTLVVVCADHGESLGQHGEPTHAALCYEPTIRVPLVVRPPGGVTPAQRVAEPVSVVDVAPTIARVLGAQLPSDVDGLDLLQPRPADRTTYFESYYGWLNHGWSPLAGIAGARGKLLVSNGVELYEPRADLREKNDLSAERAEDVAWLRARLDAVALLPAHALDARVTAQAVEAAARLGYAGGVASGTALPAPGAPSDLPAPRTKMGELRAFYAAIEAVNAGQRADGIERMRVVASVNERNVAANDVLAAWLVADRNFALAEVHARAALVAGGDRVTVHTSLAACATARGDADAAIGHYLRALELRPGTPEQIAELVRLLESRGRTEEARKWREQGGV